MIQHNSQKPYWCPELQELKQASIDAHNLWKLCDKSRSGIINRLRLESNYKYKLAIRELSYRNSMMICLTCIYERVWINFRLSETLNFLKCHSVQIM